LQTSQKKFPVVVACRMLHGKHALRRNEFLSALTAGIGFRDLCPGKGSADPYVSQT